MDGELTRRSEGATGEAPDPLAVILEQHDLHLSLCDLLEEIADGLPDQVHAAKCQSAIEQLSERVFRHHQFEENLFFPLLRTRAVDDSYLQASLDRLEREHRVDEGYADEVLELLHQLIGGHFRGSADAAGYMLRGLFEALRRHIAFENDFVLPRADVLLTSDDRAHLVNAMRTQS